MIGDNYTSDSVGVAYEEGVKSLTVSKLNYVTSRSKGTEGISFELIINGNPEHKMYKTFYESKLFNRFFTSFINALKLDPKELDEAAKVGRFREWIERKIPGRTGEFLCEKGEPNNEGKRYLSPITQAEIDLRDWIKSQNSGHTSSGNFSDGSSPDSMTPPDFTDDITF